MCARIITVKLNDVWLRYWYAGSCWTCLRQASSRITIVDQSSRLHDEQVLSSSWDGRLFGHNRHWLEIGGCVPLGDGAELGPHLTRCGLGRGLPSYQVPSWFIQPFGHSSHGPKSGRLCMALFRGRWVPISTISDGSRPTSSPSDILIHPALWPQWTWAENWGIVPPFFWGGGAGSPSNTMWPGPTPIFHAKFHFWFIQPFRHNTPMLQTHISTERQTGQTDRQRSDSTGRTVLQTVAQKCSFFDHGCTFWGDIYTLNCNRPTTNTYT